VLNSKVPQRIAISQRFFPRYRLDFFQELESRLRADGHEVRLFFSYTIGEMGAPPPWAQRVRAVRADLRFGELEDSAVLTPGLLWRLIRFAPDVVITEDLGGLPNSLLVAVYCRLWKKPYLIWGLGEVPRKARSPLRKLLAPAIRFLYDGASGFICYSSYAAAVYARYAKPTYVAPNSYLRPPTRTEILRVEQAIDAKYRDHADTLQIISIGTLKTQKRYDVLIAAVARIKRTVCLHIVGDGPEMPHLRELAGNLGVSSKVLFHGAVFDDASKATLLTNAHIGVMPGRGGLAIQEMMAYGVPVISGVADGTERDMVVDGKNGFLFESFPTADELAAAVDRFASLSDLEQSRLARAALEVVVRHSNIHAMSDGFARAVLRAVHA
jgi:glycosyltransferase involved in cell wall biosynthesis